MERRGLGRGSRKRMGVVSGGGSVHLNGLEDLQGEPKAEESPLRQFRTHRREGLVLKPRRMGSGRDCGHTGVSVQACSSWPHWSLLSPLRLSSPGLGGLEGSSCCFPPPRYPRAWSVMDPNLKTLQTLGVYSRCSYSAFVFDSYFSQYGILGSKYFPHIDLFI